MLHRLNGGAKDLWVQGHEQRLEETRRSLDPWHLGSQAKNHGKTQWKKSPNFMLDKDDKDSVKKKREKNVKGALGVLIHCTNWGNPFKKKGQIRSQDAQVISQQLPSLFVSFCFPFTEPNWNELSLRSPGDLYDLYGLAQVASSHTWTCLPPGVHRSCMLFELPNGG